MPKEPLVAGVCSNTLNWDHKWVDFPAKVGPKTEVEKAFEKEEKKKPPEPSVERRMLPSWL